MLDYQSYPCVYCDKATLIYNQYVGDDYCESCGEWQADEEE